MNKKVIWLIIGLVVLAILDFMIVFAVFHGFV